MSEYYIVQPQRGPQSAFINVPTEIHLVFYGGRNVPPFAVMRQNKHL